MILTQFSNLFKSFGLNSIFEDITLSIKGGDVFALVGENGAGKSTFLKLLSGKLLLDEGKIFTAPNLSIAFMPQEVVIQDPTITVPEFLEDRALSDLERKMAIALDKE